jgi:hypothetical protein
LLLLLLGLFYVSDTYSLTAAALPGGYCTVHSGIGQIEALDLKVLASAKTQKAMQTEITELHAENASLRRKVEEGVPPPES